MLTHNVGAAEGVPRAGVRADEQHVRALALRDQGLCAEFLGRRRRCRAGLGGQECLALDVAVDLVVQEEREAAEQGNDEEDEPEEDCEDAQPPPAATRTLAAATRGPGGGSLGVVVSGQFVHQVGHPSSVGRISGGDWSMPTASPADCLNRPRPRVDG